MQNFLVFVIYIFVAVVFIFLLIFHSYIPPFIFYSVKKRKFEIKKKEGDGRWFFFKMVLDKTFE